MGCIQSTTMTLTLHATIIVLAAEMVKADIYNPYTHPSTNRRFLHDLRSLLRLYLGEKVLQPETFTPHGSDLEGGAVFTRWGRTTCPSGNDVMYKGYAGGSHYQATGGPGTTLCLPEAPIYANHSPVGSQSDLYGAEYQTDAETAPLHKLFQDDIPCVVCHSRHRRSAAMVPARNECFPGWHLEYKGYLFGGATEQYTGHTDYVCVDGDAEAIAGGKANTNGHILYLVDSKCGTLPCPPYVEGWELTCALCTK
ncbi:uncharacterized protein [Haliotis cracherodii]|uniref:uncharacterized protein n=1 Tax=Haliotis cracherodii TaxID=6455 RepID=UPI0039E8BDBD